MFAICFPCFDLSYRSQHATFLLLLGSARLAQAGYTAGRVRDAEMGREEYAGEDAKGWGCATSLPCVEHGLQRRRRRRSEGHPENCWTENYNSRAG